MLFDVESPISDPFAPRHAQLHVLPTVSDVHQK